MSVDAQVIVLDLYHTIEGSKAAVEYVESKGYKLLEGKNDPVIFVKNEYYAKLTPKHLQLLGQKV